jgi:soluble lytic murein transglycosylase-like protein
LLLHRHIVFAAVVVGCALPSLVQAREVEPTIYDLVTRIAEEHGVDPALAHAVVEVESGYDCSAKNRRSTATGPMQVLKGTARAVGVSGDLRDCRTGLEAGMRYLKKMVVAAHGNECAAASAYNRGSVRGCSAYGRKVVANMQRSSRVAQL